MPECKCHHRKHFLDRYSYDSSEGMLRFLECQGYEITKDGAQVDLTELANAWRKHGNLPEPWDADHPQDDICKCGHAYHRHFDGYEDNYPIGCKYCDCDSFEHMELTQEQVELHDEHTCIVPDCGGQTFGSDCFCRDHQPHRGY